MVSPTGLITNNDCLNCVAIVVLSLHVSLGAVVQVAAVARPASHCDVTRLL